LSDYALDHERVGTRLAAHGQEEYLKGAVLVRKPYRAYSETWEHDHCEFCFAKFMDPAYSEAHRMFVEQNPDVLIEGTRPQRRIHREPTTTGYALLASMISQTHSSGAL
jgi:hypothetical protein